MPSLFHNMAKSAQECFAALEELGQITFPGMLNGSLWCNATWDTVLCWPAIPANTSHTLPCPPLRGLDTEKTITKACHAAGHWVGRNDVNLTTPYGWTNYTGCMNLDVRKVLENLPTPSALTSTSSEMWTMAKGQLIFLILLCFGILLLTNMTVGTRGERAPENRNKKSRGKKPIYPTDDIDLPLDQHS